ncbi:MAG: tRNA 2-thiouridine(34) synthase MnmA [Wenzhouxiangella sp.]|nr:MAG: tRNA 2-thiouridine(34) synthase MnmA [Wenzhouxiangella sp.]
MVNKTPDIMVALSGGVDSATTAWLLKRQGHAIAGMFMKNWEEEDAVSGCSAEEDADDARRVCEQLGIAFHGRNFSAEYWDDVFEHFLAELRIGRTPNPDVLCNREIKFKAFVEHALDLGAGRIATGHYARRRDNPDGTVSLLKGRDAGKDQSYFLYALSQEQLARALFPLGEMDKTQVRALAAEADLAVAAKKDSTGICFIGERNYDRFIDQYLSAEPGPILTPDGQLIGRHKGLIHYTLGQRKGLDIGGRAGFSEAAWYVAAKDLHGNRLCAVQDGRHPLLMSTRLRADTLNWISGQAPAAGRKLTAKVRYRQADQRCTVTRCSDRVLELHFDAPQRAVTPGQSVVLYDGDECLGGGVIAESNAPRPSWLTASPQSNPEPT